MYSIQFNQLVLSDSADVHTCYVMCLYHYMHWQCILDIGVSFMFIYGLFREVVCHEIY